MCTLRVRVRINEPILEIYVYIYNSISGYTYVYAYTYTCVCFMFMGLWVGVLLRTFDFGHVSRLKPLNARTPDLAFWDLLLAHALNPKP